MSARDAGIALGVSPQHVKVLIGQGRLEGTQLSDGTWVIDSTSLTSFIMNRTAAGRTWSPRFAWALLYELSGIEQHGLSPSTRSRIRSRIRTLEPAELVSKVATRLTIHRYHSDHRARTAAALIPTGRSATDAIGSNLTAQTHVVDGYLRDDSLEQFVADHLLIASPRGDVAIFVTPESLEWTTTLPPRAVIAADLALSMDPRERAAGLEALTQMMHDWIATHRV